jgi:fumarylpyruvate hydrolase
MSDYVIDPGRRPTLPVLGRDARFPVHRVYCIGRNYADHAVEMGHDPDREPPFFFLKNPDNLDPSGTFPYPPESRDVHHEVELAVALGRGGDDIAAEDAAASIYGYAVSLDMTRRDLRPRPRSSLVPGRSPRRSSGPPRSARSCRRPTLARSTAARSRSP